MLRSEVRLPRVSDFALVIFDWDGTVVDTTLFAIQSAGLACEERGLPKPDFSTVSHLICRSPFKALARVMPSLAPDELESLVKRFKHYYYSRSKYLRPVDGMRRLIAGLNAKGVLLAVATGKSRVGLERDISATELGSVFWATRTAEESEPKPSPRMVLELCEGAAVLPRETLVVGDTCNDIVTAHRAGAKAVALCYGAQARTDLKKCHPLQYFDTVSDVDH